MLHKSPKTLSNIFSTCKLPSPLRVIHERIEAEAKRLLLYSTKSSKEIADLLGFEDQSSFSRFFKNMTGQSTVQFRNEAEKQENSRIEITQIKKPETIYRYSTNHTIKDFSFTSNPYIL